jgi:hypothetical protein
MVSPKKESFLLYKSFYEPIKTMSDNQIGRLFKSLFEYQINGTENVDDDIKIPFCFFKNQMDLDAVKYASVVARNQQNGALGGRKPKQTQKNPKNPVGYFEPKKPDNDNDNDNVNEKDNDIDKTKNLTIFNFKNELLKFVNDEILVSDFLKVRKSKKAVNSETAFNLFKNECERNNFPMEEAVKICIQRNWQTFKMEWYQKSSSFGKQQPTGGKGIEDALFAYEQMKK